MRQPVRIGIVGLGRMGGIRARTIDANPDAIAVAGSDVTVPKSGFDGLQICEDYEAVIASDVDAVFVCTPNRFSPDIVVAALDAGKHVLCEKPPGCNMEDIERIIEAERRNPGLTLKFGFNHRYHLGIVEARRIVDSECYGRVLWARGVYGKGERIPDAANWRNDPEKCGGGILLDQGIHMVDLLRYFCGDISEIKSMCATAFWNTPMEDNAFALLRTKTGQIATLHSSFTQWKHLFQLDICMADGYLTVDGMPSSTRSYRDETITHARRRTSNGFTVGNPPEESRFFNSDPSWEMELEEFVDCVNNDRPLRHGTSTDAYEAMRMVHAIYENDSSVSEQRENLRDRERALQS